MTEPADLEVALPAASDAAAVPAISEEGSGGDALQQALGVAVAMVVCVSQEGSASMMSSTDDRIKTLTEQTFFCETCSQRFFRRSHLARHRLIHSGERPFVCDVCGKCFRQSSHLSSHKNTHTGARPYQCNHCDKAFASSSALGRHRHTHTDPSTKPHVCPTCGKAFRRLSHLVGHKYTHTGERPFRCTECDSAFADSSGLRRHRRRHSAGGGGRCSVNKRAVNRVRTPRNVSALKKGSSESGDLAEIRSILAATVHQVVLKEAEDKGLNVSTLDTSYDEGDGVGGEDSDEEVEEDLSCAVCKATFDDRSDLIKHAKASHDATDKPFRCGRCGKCFTKSGHLRRHVRTHTSVRPFPCDICNKSFRQSSHLAAHKNTHTGDRPFKCPVCDRGFADSSALNKHRRRHRPNMSDSQNTSQVLEDSQQSYMVNGEESAASVVVDTGDSIMPQNVVNAGDGMVTVTLAPGEEGSALTVTSLENPLASLASVSDNEAAQQLLTLITNSNHVLLNTSGQTSLSDPATSSAVTTVTAPSLPPFLPFMQPATVSFVTNDSNVVVQTSSTSGQSSASDNDTVLVLPQPAQTHVLPQEDGDGADATTQADTMTTTSAGLDDSPSPD